MKSTEKNFRTFFKTNIQEQLKMSYPSDVFDKTKHNYLQKCFYIINLLKDKNFDIWENFHAQYCSTKPEESWELYQMLVEEYKKIITPPKVKAIKKPVKKVAKKAVKKSFTKKKAA